MANINIYWIKKNFIACFFNYWKQYIFYPIFENNIWKIQKKSQQKIYLISITTKDADYHYLLPKSKRVNRKTWEYTK